MCSFGNQPSVQAESNAPFLIVPTQTPRLKRGSFTTGGEPWSSPKVCDQTENRVQGVNMTVIPDLVFDIGLHLGEDTAYYLAKGYRVVAFEANPKLVAACQARFADAIRAGRLTIISGAITDANVETVRFWFNDDLTVWGTADPSWVARNQERGTTSTEVEVPAVHLARAFEDHGVPYFFKADVEGADRIALESLWLLKDRPKFVSYESNIASYEALEAEIALLRALGYSAFLPVQQETIPGTTITTRTLTGEPLKYTFERHGSGAFGDDLPGRWLTYSECRRAYRLIFARYRLLGHSSPLARFGVRRLVRRANGWLGPVSGWHDLHARRD